MRTLVTHAHIERVGLLRPASIEPNERVELGGPRARLRRRRGWTLTKERVVLFAESGVSRKTP